MSDAVWGGVVGGEVGGLTAQPPVSTGLPATIGAAVGWKYTVRTRVRFPGPRSV